MSDTDKENDFDSILDNIVEETDTSNEDESVESSSESAFEPNFGDMSCDEPKLNVDQSTPFRLVVIGDFSGRANRMDIYDRDQLANLKGHLVDVDTVEDLPARFKIDLDLDLAGTDETISYEPRSIDAFHPDEIIDEIELFDELKGLLRSLKNQSTFSSAAATIDEWLEDQGEKPIAKGNSRGSVIPADKKLSDFSSLIGREVAEPQEASDITELLGRIVAPYITPADDPQLDDYIAIVEEAMTTTMRQILEHPDFQNLESVWRVIDLLARRIETSNKLKITLYDISAEDFAADLSSTDKLDETGLYRLFVENALQDENIGTPSAIVGLYTFDMTPPHAELLGRMAKICAHAHAPFLTSLDRNNANRKFDDLPSITTKTWQSLKAMPESNYIGLCLPRFMLRMPYGAKTDPIDSFHFEEFDEKIGLKAMLWGNPAALIGLVLAVDYQTNGGAMKPGSILTVDDMPFHYVHDQYGDQVALPCTDRMVSHRTVTPLLHQNLIPIVSMKGQPEVRIASLSGLAGNTVSGRWGEQITVTHKPRETGGTLNVGINAPEGAVVIEGPDPNSKETPVTRFRIEPDEPEEVPAAAEEEEASSEELEATPAAAPAEPEDDGQAELDDLLAEISSEDSASEPAGDEEIDPELEALLADL